MPDWSLNTEGRDIADAIFMARDVISLMGIAKEDDGEAIPAPGEVTYALKEGDIETYVDVDFLEYRKKYDNKKVRKTVAIPLWIDIRAKAERIDLSRTLEQALLKEMNLMD